MGLRKKGWEEMGQDGMGRDGLRWDGIGWDKMGLDEMGWEEMGREGMGHDGMGWNGIGWDGMRWDRRGWDGIGWGGMGWERMGQDGRGCDVMRGWLPKPGLQHTYGQSQPSVLCRALPTLCSTECGSSRDRPSVPHFTAPSLCRGSAAFAPSLLPPSRDTSASLPK